MKKLLCLMLCVALLLSGCGKNETENPALENPDHIYREVAENLLVDCDVSGFAPGEEPKVYEARIQEYSEEQVLAFLEWNHEEFASKEDTGRAFMWNCEDGSWFYTDYDGKDYAPVTASFLDMEKIKPFWQYMFSGGQQSREEGMGWNVDFFFEEPVDLPFASREEAELAVREGLELMGLHDLTLNQTLCISHEKMPELEAMMQVEPWKDRVRGDREPFVFDWSDENDCYRFEFFMTVDGKPLAYRDKATSVSSYVGAGVMVYYSPCGIIEMQITGAMEVVGESQASGALISAEQAVRTVSDKYENILSSSLRTITEADLVYVYRQDGDRWLLCPVWEIVVKQEPHDYVDFVTTTIVRIDAFTGNQC